MKKRLDWLDIAKGIGILLVVVGHAVNINGKLFHLIFTFHMPLFFVLSGYVFSGKDSFVTLLKKKSKSLLLPFAGYYLLGLAVTLALPQWRHGLTLHGIKQDLWLADPNAVHNSSIWFLVCLFFVVILFHFIRKTSLYIQFFLLLSSYCFGIWYSKSPVAFMGYSRLPFNIDVAAVAIVFFALGYYANKGGVMASLSRHWWNELFAAIIGIAGVYLVYIKNGYVNLHGLSFGRSELYLLGGLFGTIAIVGLSSLISRMTFSIFKYFKNIFVWYGRNSLTVLGIQSLLIRLYIVVMNDCFDQQLVLYGFSTKHAVFCSVLVGLVICPTVCLLMNRIKKLKKGA